MRKSLIAVSLLALGHFATVRAEGMPPYTSDPGPHAGNYEATLTGTGQSNTEFDRSNFGVTGSMGYYYTKNWLFSLKQGLQANDSGDETLINSRTIFQAAYQWDLAKWQPYLGLNAGGVYGAGIHDQALFGPEVGVKYFVNESTFMFANIAYEVPFDACCNDGNIPYSVGVGFDF
ncbi:MAG: hypothetical protein AB7I01_09095 [Gammaproteobacteria bacterium]